MFEVFNNRSKYYISQTVPVKAGSSLRLSLLLHDDCNCCAAWLVIRADNGKYRWIPMAWESKEFDCFNRWTVDFTAEQSGIYWYRFEFEGNWQRNVITRVNHGFGDITAKGDDWQLTVYDADFTTPEQNYGGLIYQIFPDRFYSSGEKKSDVPSDRYIVTDWYSQPAWRQNNGAQSLCNDYYGGDLRGITEKLPYISSLGVTLIYLNPIFEAHSNHRYNTADYMRIDPSLGTLDDFRELCQRAKEYGIGIILDGVFSHTGDDSRYFNKYNRYNESGAYNSQSSRYYSWFKFDRWPDKCHCWWGVPSLPETVEDDPDFTEFICGENGVLRYWLRQGASGWRLDVADELPDSFLDSIRRAIKSEKPDALLLGEVWEDASTKISYGARRRFIIGKQLDSVMNYPFCNAIIDFIRGGDADKFTDTVMDIIGNYPPCALNSLMNHIGTHDTARILSVLGGAPLDLDRAGQSGVCLAPHQREHGLVLLRLAAVLQYTLPGIPSLYYGDEAGCEGLADPFNRMGYPWGREDSSLIDFYKKLGQIRKNPSFAGGEFIPIYANGGALAYMRRKGENSVIIAVNRSEQPVNISTEKGDIKLAGFSFYIG